MIKTSLSKIKNNRLNKAINNLKWKGKSFKENISFLDYKTQEYKEEIREYTIPFSDDPEDIKNFIKRIEEKTINDDNYNEIMNKIITFTEEYKINITDKRKTKEELLKEKEDAKKRAEEQKKKQEQEEKEMHDKGLLTDSEKISLGTTEITKRIREQVKKEFPDCKFSITKEHTSSININLMTSNFNPFAKKEDIIKHMESKARFSDYDIEDFKKHWKDIPETYNLNHKWLDEDFKINDKARNMFKRIVEIANHYNYDHSDIRTDYFNTNFYLDLEIGKWDKPFKVLEVFKRTSNTSKSNSSELKTKGLYSEHKTTTKNNVLISKNEELNGIELKFNDKPDKEVLSLLKGRGYRWNFKKMVWYKRFSEDEFNQIKNLLEVKQ